MGTCPARRWTLVVTLVAGGLAACSAPFDKPAHPAPVRSEAPPELRPGDRWVFDWKTGNETATKTIEVVEIREVNRVQYYVMRRLDVQSGAGDEEHFYTLDLHWAAIVRNAKVESRMVPPQPWFVWPLEVGRRWEHRGTFEEAERKRQHHDTFAVVAVETVQVPAGRFHALKLARETDRRDSDVYWFAPDVRWYVKWTGRRDDTQFEEQLREFRLSPRLIRGPEKK